MIKYIIYDFLKSNSLNNSLLMSCYNNEIVDLYKNNKEKLAELIYTDIMDFICLNKISEESLTILDIYALIFMSLYNFDNPKEKEVIYDKPRIEGVSC